MSIRNTNTKVYLYLNDYNAVCGEIYRHERIETGGNLFGLWTTERNVVVHVPLGPGENCKRTNVSFHLDVAYLSRVRSFLNKKFMLCHIGEWYSHHRLSLNEPSSVDKRAVKDNYPNGVKKFLVFIGNIVESGQIRLSPYFFSENGNTCEKGILQVLDTHGPFTTAETILKEMNEGAEIPRQPIQNPSLFQASQASTFKVGASHPPSSGSDLNTLKSGSGSPPADKNYLSISQTTPSSPSEPPTMAAQSSTQPSASNNPSIANSSSANESDDGKQTRKEVIMKKVFDEIKSRFEDSGVAIGGVMSGLIEMTFKHKKCHWFLKFPETFPKKPASIFYSFSEKFSDAFECNYNKREFLNNHIDILLTIKSECNSSSTYCASCKKVNVESLAQSNSTIDLFLTEEANAMIKQLQDKAKETLHVDTGSLKKMMICDDATRKNAILEVSFTHSLMQWMIQVSSTFPSRPAKLYCKKVKSNYFGESLNHIYYEMGRDSSKDWVSEILFAIAKRCDCVNCKLLKFT